MKSVPPLAALAFISAGTLVYVILLTRLFSIIQWHHFAYMMVSLAMLGYGVSGTILTLLRKCLLPHYESVFALCATAFGISAIGAFLLAQYLPFNPLELFWNIHQPIYLFFIYILLAVPIMFSASCIGLTFIRYGAAAHRVYSFDLFGAAGGCLLALLLLVMFSPMAVLRVVGMLGLAGAALGIWHFRLRLRVMLPLLAIMALTIALILPVSWMQLRISPYKGLSQTLHIPGTRVLEQRSGQLGLLTVVESVQIPFRHAPGLSLNAVQEPPAQLGIFTDGDNFSALTSFDGRLEPLGYLGQTTSALPYHLLQQPHVLVLGAGAGSAVLQALVHHAPKIEAIDVDAAMVDLVRNRFSSFSGDLYKRPQVMVHVAEARSFVARSDAFYDLIQVELMDAFIASSSGLYGLSESYLYTVEGLQSYLQHLKPDGILALTRWVTLPPRDMLKLAATVIAAQKREGVSSPGLRMALIRGWQTATLLVKNGEFTPDDIARIRDFANARSFDVEWLPGLKREESNHYNMLDQPYFYDGMQALLGPQSQDFIDRYKFDIRSPTDDRPYFFHFFRWQTLPEILNLHARGGLSLLELGYPILLTTLLQALLASVLLILLPLWLGLRGKCDMRDAPEKLAIFSYFTLIGIAYMFIEISFIQKFTLYLGHPHYAIAGVLCTILLFSGLGSRNAPLLLNWLHDHKINYPRFLAAGIALMVILNLLILPLLGHAGIHLPAIMRVLAMSVLIAPLAFLMGMPFPIGMALVNAKTPVAVPWAWGVNACATVVGAALSALLALHTGFNGVAILAVALYAFAGLILQALVNRQQLKINTTV